MGSPAGGVQAGTGALPRTARAMTLGAVLSRTTATYPDRVAHRCEGEQRTYAELDVRVDRLAAALRARGVGAGGWFHSGDLCRMDEEGFTYVVDRKKDLIISGGEHIYCSEVEVVIDRHPKVSQVAVVGLPHEKWVETPAAFVVAADPADPPTKDEVIAFCREHMASYQKPTAVQVVDELPRNSKVLKTVLRDGLKP